MPEWQNILTQEDKTRALSIDSFAYKPIWIFPLDLNLRLGLAANDAGTELISDDEVSIVEPVDEGDLVAYSTSGTKSELT